MNSLNNHLDNMKKLANERKIKEQNIIFEDQQRIINIIKTDNLSSLKEEVDICKDNKKTLSNLCMFAIYSDYYLLFDFILTLDIDYSYKKITKKYLKEN